MGVPTMISMSVLRTFNIGFLAKPHQSHNFHVIYIFKLNEHRTTTFGKFNTTQNNMF